MGTACLVTLSEALWGECGYFLCDLNIRHISLHWMNMYATIHISHHRKDIDKHAQKCLRQRICAKIKSIELRLVLCCHLVDSGGCESVWLQNAIYICHDND